MPRHLLGKKSWNVYNEENVARVKRDEAEAAAREAAEEQKIQEEDADRRIRLLRGEKVQEIASSPIDEEAHSQVRHASGRERKRRRLRGEDDTDRDIRFAKEDAEQVVDRSKLQVNSRKAVDAPLVDEAGHINLFPMQQKEKERKPTQKSAMEAERSKPRKEQEDQHSMRFSDAAGRRQDIHEKPWYQESAAYDKPRLDLDAPLKDVWGNEDTGRKEREKMRMVADDPLALMKKGASAVREIEKYKNEWAREKRREIEALDKEQSRSESRRRRKERKDLESFKMDDDHRSYGGREPRSAEHHRRHHHRSRKEEKARRSHG